MTDTTTQALVDSRKVKLVRLIILSGWVLTLLLMISIVGAALYLSIAGQEVPKMLEQWGGVALGFLFGSFSKIVADYVGDE